MAAPKGNRFWEARSSHGRNPKFESPEALWAACCEYFEWVEANPLAGEHIPIVPVYGEWSFAGDKECYEGVVRLTKDGQRLRNMIMSFNADIVGRSPKKKPTFFPEQIEGYEYMYGGNEDYPYYLQNRTDENGNDLPIGPISYMENPEVPQANAYMLEAATNSVKEVASIGVDAQAANGQVAFDTVNQLNMRADLETYVFQDIQNPEQLSHMLTTMSLGALGPEKAFAVQDKMVGREIDRGKLAETIRSNQAGEALQARGQNLSYQSAMTGHNIAAQRLALDQQEFGFKMQQAQEKAQQLISEAPKLSVNMEKGIETAVNNATASSNSANSMSALAQQFRAEKPTTGLFGNAQNMFAKLTGSDTTLRDLRIRQNALVNSQVLKFLPPGPATDKDVEIVRQGAPTDMDNPETVARWLDAMANLERRNAQFNEFKAEWMSANGNPGQSRNGGQILGLDVKKGESLGSAVKRYMSLNTDAAPAQDSIPSGEPRNQVGSYTSKSGIQFTVE